MSSADVLAWFDSALRNEREAVNSLLDSQHAGIRKELEAQLMRHCGYPDDAARPFTDRSAGELKQEMTKDVVVIPVSLEPSSQSQSSLTPVSSTRNSTWSGSKNRLRSGGTNLALQILTESGTSTMITKLVTTTGFELIAGFLIMANAIVLCFETQYRGFDIGYEMGLNQTGTEPTRPAHEVWPRAKDAFDVMDVVFGACFTLELVLKVIGLQHFFFRSLFNWFDMAVVGAWWVGKLVQSNAVGSLTLLRLVRLVRLLRPLRLIRSMVMFDTLHMLVGALSSSMYVLGWSLLLVMLILATMAIFMNAILQQHMLNLANGQVGVDTYKYFGTFSNSMLTMFEFTFGNWVPVCRHLYENIDEWLGPLAVAYRFATGFAFITVIRAVFILETFKAASSDTDLMIMQKQRQIKKHSEQMDLLFKETDTSGDGFLSFDEFKEVLHDARVKSWLGSLELEVEDVPLLFELTDANLDGQISGPELVCGFAGIKGLARRIDMLKLEKGVQRIGRLEGDVLSKLDTSLAKNARRIINI